MMRWIGIAGVPLWLLLGAAHPAPDRSVTYALAPIIEDGRITALAVTITLNADPSGRTVIDWVDSWAGDQKLGRWARNIAVDGARAVALAPFGGRIITSAPGARLTMRYRIVSAYDVDPTATNSEQSLPVVRPDWFYAVGEALYARPVGRDDAPARFAWKGPLAIRFASDTEHATGLRGHPRTVADITESIAIGGQNLVVSTVTMNGAPVRIAHLGRFGFDVAAFERTAHAVVAAERDFWRDRASGPFLITSIPLAPVAGRLSYSGTGRSDAFATWIDRDAELSGLTWLLAHEYFHSWNARQLGRFPEGRSAEAYWLSEGFTDFYARRLMLRAGLWTPQAFVTDWNEMLRAYAASPYRMTDNVTAAAKYWSGDYAASKLPYQRGALLATLWDRALRASGRIDLDAVLRAQRDRAAAMPEPGEVTAMFAEEMRRAGYDVAADIDRFLTKGAPVELPEDAFGACARVTTANLPVFERGWDTEATAKAGNVFAGVDPASNAYAAGLRNGMTFKRRVEGRPGDSSIDYVLEVQDGSAVRTIRFRPAGRRTLRTQQIVLDEARFAADPADCARKLAG